MIRPPNMMDRVAPVRSGGGGPGRATWGAALLLVLLAGGCRGEIAATGPTATVAGPPTPVPSVVASPSPTATPFAPQTASPTPACAFEPGAWEEGTYSGKEVPQQVPFLVYLPPCYAQGSRLYPVIYVLHGKPYDQRQWPDLGLGETADRGRREGRWGEFVIVSPLQPEPLFSRTDGGPGSYEVEFLEGLMPAIDADYRVDPRPEARALAGISRGGVWALEIAFRHPESFRAVAALSPALAVNSARPAYDPLELARSSVDLPPGIFLGAGEQDWARRHTEQLAQILIAAGVPVEQAYVLGDHSGATWQALLPDTLEHLAQGWGDG